MEKNCSIVSVKSDINKEIQRIQLSDGSLFSYKICYLPANFPETLLDPNTAAESEITSFEETAFRHASACLRAEKAALKLIARAEQCRSGLFRKLEKRGHEAACVSAVINRICSLQLIDDRRYAQLWLESRLRLPRTPRRLLAALCAKGIDRDDAESSLKEVLDEETEYALLLRFIKKHERKKSSRNDDTRSLKFLLKGEGFSIVAIQRYATFTQEQSEK